MPLSCAPSRLNSSRLLCFSSWSLYWSSLPSCRECMYGIVAQSAGNPLFSSNMGMYINPDARFCTHEPRSDGIPPYAETQLVSFNPAQPYDISLHLVVPTTQSNYDLGNFMTTLTLLDRSNRTLTTVRKPVSPPLDPIFVVHLMPLTGDHHASIFSSMVQSQHYDFGNTPSNPLCIRRRPRYCQD